MKPSRAHAGVGAGSATLEQERAAVRGQIFSHLAGFVLAPTVKALADRGAFEPFEQAGRAEQAERLDGGTGTVEFETIAHRTHANRGYLRVALRLLASSGWLEQHTRENGRLVSYTMTEAGRVATRMAPSLYAEVLPFLPKALFLQDCLFGAGEEPLLPSLRELVRRAESRWGLDAEGDARDRGLTGEVTRRLRLHLDGVLVGPAMVALARGGVFAALERGPAAVSALPGNAQSLTCVLDLLATQGWVLRQGERVELTSAGRYAAQIATAYGVTVSYLPLFTMLNTLLYGNPRFPHVDENGFEVLVDRAMNVWGSGGAHRTYFKKVDEIIIEIFNRPLHLQPRGICDMGCGDGTFLEHLYFVVRERTARGSVLDQHPLVMVGADFNKVARRVTKQTLRQAGIPTYHVIPGDINRPAQLASDLEKLGHDIHDLLHIRSFLDHNRPYSLLANYVSGTRKARSSGAFAHLGKEILPDELEENLVRHLRRWAPYIGRFGLLALELHTLPPELTAAHPEKTPAVGYDGTHGYSDQYLVELDVFLECAREAGLRADPRYQASFPPSELATVSINFFTAG